MDTNCLTAETVPDQDAPASLPDEVADAWAAVLIDIYEKRKREEDRHGERQIAD